ncbi:hypothetical protein ACWDDN_42255 [Streptomyces griseoruber]
MESRYLARLRFVAASPAVQGEWTVLATAEERYTTWVGLYSQNTAVVIQLIEEANGQERVLRSWTAQGETASENV